MQKQYYDKEPETEWGIPDSEIGDRVAAALKDPEVKGIKITREPQPKEKARRRLANKQARISRKKNRG